VLGCALLGLHVCFPVGAAPLPAMQRAKDQRRPSRFRAGYYV
jgi:hypothetical protein